MRLASNGALLESEIMLDLKFVHSLPTNKACKNYKNEHTFSKLKFLVSSLSYILVSRTFFAWAIKIEKMGHDHWCSPAKKKVAQKQFVGCLHLCPQPQFFAIFCKSKLIVITRQTVKALFSVALRATVLWLGLSKQDFGSIPGLSSFFISSGGRKKLRACQTRIVWYQRINV